MFYCNRLSTVKLSPAIRHRSQSDSFAAYTGISAGSFSELLPPPEPSSQLCTPFALLFPLCSCTWRLTMSTNATCLHAGTQLHCYMVDPALHHTPYRKHTLHAQIMRITVGENCLSEGIRLPILPSRVLGELRVKGSCQQMPRAHSHSHFVHALAHRLLVRR